MNSSVAHQCSFVRLDQSDIKELLHLEKQCFSLPWSEEQYNVGLKQKAFHVFGLRLQESLVAYISFYTVKDEMEILNIAVDPAQRRQGLGSYLLGLILQICAEMGIKQTFLEVRESNTSAVKLYRNHGYIIEGKRKAYYPDTQEDALLMRKLFTKNVGEQP